MTLLQLKDVTRRFGGVVAVNSVGLTIQKSEVIGLMGANGAGKTTLFSLIAGNLSPSTGEILFDDQRIDGLRPDQISRLGVARTFQIVRPFAGLTVLENVTISALFGSSRTRSMTRATTIAREVLEEVELTDRAEDYASALTLSGRKRLEIARALATSPKLLMLDEVMAGLTPTEGADAVAMIRRFQKARSLTVIVVEHVMGILMELCPRIVVLHHGALIAEGSPQEVANDPQVIDSYLGTR